MSNATSRGVLVGAAFLLLLGHARAEDAPPSNADKEARSLFFRGDRLYEEGKYEDAVEAFEKAYKLSRRPELLFNLANAYERLGQYEEALRTLRDYAPQAPQDEREKIETRIATLERRAEERRHAEQTSDTSSPATPVSPAEPEPEESKETKSKPPILAYTLIAGGAASIGVGAFFGIRAMNANKDAEDQCVERGGLICPQSAKEAIDDAGKRALIADIGFGVGAVAAGVGVVLLLTRNRSEEDGRSATALQVAPRAGGGELGLVGSF